VFLLAVAAACVLAGAQNFREIGDQAGGLPQEVLARLGGRPHPLLRTIIVPGGKRIRTVLREVSAARLDELTGGWLRGLAGAGRLENLLRAIAIDGKWLRGIGGGQQVELFAVMLHEQKVIIAQHAIPEDTNKITQVRELLDPVNLAGAVVTGDPCGPLMLPIWTSRTSPGPSGSAATAATPPAPWSPRRSCTPSPACAKTAPVPQAWQRSPAAGGVSNRSTGVRGTACREDPGTGYRGSGPQVMAACGKVMAACRNIAISLRCLAGVTAVNRTLRAIGCDRARMLSCLPL
jgi:hypothetical protein